MQLLRNRILVKPYENSELSHGGVYTGVATTTFTPEDGKKKQQTVGEVISVGKGIYSKKGKRRPPDTPIGSYVTFSDTCGKKVKINDEDLLVITENDVMFFMDEPTTVELVYRD